MIDAADAIPAATVADPDLKGFVWAFIDVPAEARDNAVERVNVTIPRRALHAIGSRSRNLVTRAF